MPGLAPRGSVVEQTARCDGGEVEPCDVHRGLLGVRAGPPASLNRRPARFRPATLYRNVGGIAFGDPASLIVFPWATGLTLAWHFW